jgi:hypothetical protein
MYGGNEVIEAFGMWSKISQGESGDLAASQLRFASPCFLKSVEKVNPSHLFIIGQCRKHGLSRRAAVNAGQARKVPVSQLRTSV